MEILYKDIDEPGLNTLDVYQRRGGYDMLRQALDMDAAGGARAAAGLQRARPRRRRLPDGQEGLLPAQGRHGQVPRLQRRRVRARDLQGPRAHAEEPPSADRGDGHRGLRGGGEQELHLHPRRVRTPGRRPGRRARRGARGRLRRAGNPRHRPRRRPRRPPRRRRLHLRRGDRPAGLAGGQARQPAPQAPVPRQPGALPGPDAHQQRRDADERPVDPADGWRGVREDRHRELDRHEGRLDLRLRAAARQLRDRPRDELARADLRPGRRPARRRRGEGVVPRRLERAGAPRHRRVPRPALRLRRAGQGRLDARLGRDHRHRRHDPDRRRGAQDREVLPPRVLRQVHAVPRGHELDGQDARAHRLRRGHPDGPRHHGVGLRPDHRQLPVRAGRRDGDADRLDDRALPRGVRGPHRGGARAQRAWARQIPRSTAALTPGPSRCSIRPAPIPRAVVV